MTRTATTQMKNNSANNASRIPTANSYSNQPSKGVLTADRLKVLRRALRQSM